MFKDYKKYLSESIKVYLFVLIIIFILKVVGLDYFGLDKNNPVIKTIDDFFINWKLNYVWNIFTLFIQFHIYLCLVCRKKVKIVYSLFGTFLNVLFQLITFKYNIIGIEYYITSFLIMIFYPMLVNKKFMIKNQIKYIIVLSVYQFISLFVRNIGINENYNSFIIDSLLNIDQLLLLIINYILVLEKGEIVCIQEVGYSLLKKINLKKSLQKLQKNFQNNLTKFKNKSKEEKLTIIIFIILSFIWNILTIVFVLFIAFLNDTFIECIFILTSFWLSKTTFGKPFHFDSMRKCFIVSNISYYALNRITTPLGISILIPTLLGVGLSYVTSKFVKKTYKPLYRGMPKELFEETILKVEEKDTIKYKICYEFYIDRISDVSLAFKYNYSVAGIRKIKDRINKKIKELNK